MGYVLKGIQYVFGERRLRPYVWGPMAIAAVIFVGITTLAYIWLTPIAQDWISRIPGLDPNLGGVLGNVAFFILWWVISSVLYVGIAGILSSFLWDRLSREIELMEGTMPSPEAKIGCVSTVGDTIIRGGLALFVGFFAIILGWLCFGIVGVILAGWLGLMDYTANAYARRGVLIMEQFGSVYRLRGWQGFFLSAGVIALFPFLNVILLPALVAGGTLLVAKGNA